MVILPSSPILLFEYWSEGQARPIGSSGSPRAIRHDPRLSLVHGAAHFDSFDRDVAVERHEEMLDEAG